MVSANFAKGNNLKRITFLVLLGTFAVSGCGQVDDGNPRTVPASGTIVCDGSPLGGAVIVLMQDSGTHFARGISDGSGKFSLDAFETKKGAVPGSYKATVSKTVTIDKASPVKVEKALVEDAQHAAEGKDARANASWVNDLPDKYNNPATSGITVSIPENGASDLKLEVSRK